MNRAQLLRTVSDKTGMAKKEVEQVYDTMLRTVQDSVKKGEKVALTGFGNFTQRVRKGRKAGMARLWWREMNICCALAGIST